ncbi:NACHT domain-containing NTPase [Streptomyces sp. TLI_146]|uniref:NACHT domain-containing protein n=1 Tax=Streptomyces sp. TLI_146 TaxID=1938858 RepID=UPI0015D57F92|nr:NACHT domain-containing protein [Streptomyces sp. TLI_146]
MEVALVRLAGTVLSTVAKSLLSPKPGAGLVSAPVRPLPGPASPERLAKVLGRRLTDAYGSLPEHERTAAAEAVADTFAAAGEITPDHLFSLGLEPGRLRARLRRPHPGPGEALYEELLGLCCAHVVEQLTAHPAFAARAAVEQVRAAGRTHDLVADVRDRLGPRAEATALSFEERYAAYVTETHGRLELFGLTLGRSRGEWALDTAYISLAVSGERGDFGLARGDQVAVKAEQALAGADRLVLRGPAGSGKSTLVQWLALNAARRTFTGELADWNRCVPFVLRLRAFTQADALPLPDEFLRAAGVPLHVPAGWVEQLLRGGRALVLVDGVDEVPTRLRARTEAWLKSLIAAFPNARYVVTTRPSAVPVDWLSRQGFAAHSLLPMERDDIRAFIGHWHDAARGECLSDAERARLATYETSLRQAVGSRRDLGRLATNPLMCALLCALNRDRRMQLPRARKELYDAALDMLLVRRDTEREIAGVEGVELTREEQTALLQRLAYWLIRNAQVEAEQDEAREMIADWLTAMPQVRGTAEQAFAHLLIRSGLLREPAPGTVGFVHRTFQDYLGAKAAVESRDFGVLAANAHDDTWDDVVQMAVGHARADERTRLLKQLLRRADRAPKLRHRLVLLAAACLEHAPELDPAIRETVQARTRELLPPRCLDDAEKLAKVGELVLELLPGPEGLDEYEAGAVVRTAAAIRGDAAFEVISRFRGDGRGPVATQVSAAWGSFDTEEYAREVLAAGTWDGAVLTATTPEQLLALRLVPGAHRVQVTGNHSDLTPVAEVREAEYVFLYGSMDLTDLTPLASLPRLKQLGLSRCSALRDLTPIARPDLEHISLYMLDPDLSLDPLREATGLKSAFIGHPALIESVAELPLGPLLTRLVLERQIRYASLDGIERWPLLTDLTLAGQAQLRQLRAMPDLLGRLSYLGLHELESLDLRLLGGATELRSLALTECELPAGLGALRELPRLTRLWISRSTTAGHPLDLAPLADLPALTITVPDDTPFLGADLIPPERLQTFRTRP